MAVRNIRKRKARTALTVLGIVVGVTAIVALTSVSEGMQLQMTEWIKSSMGADLIVTGVGSSEIMPEGKIPDDYIDTITGLRDVKSASGQLYAMGVVEGVSSLIQGVDPDVKLSHITIRRGSMLNEDGVREAVIGQKLGSRLNIGVGDYVTLSSQSQNGKFRILGLFQTTSMMMDESCIISLRSAQELFGDEGQLSSVLVNLHDSTDASAVKSEIERLLSGVRVVEQSQVLENVKQGTEIIKTFLLMVASISMLVAGIGIMNTMIISVIERRRDIGIMKAVGMSRVKILCAFLSESILLGILGGLVGCASGIAVSKLVESLSARFYEVAMAVQISPKTLVFGFFFALALSTLSGLYPCWRATSYRPVECLRYE
ncbi:Macrolide export ATP-binding/permease protein MacB [subsurface metagenome]